MKCKNCNCQIPLATIKICPNCGEKVDKTVTQSSNKTTNQTPSQTANPNATTTKKANYHKSPTPYDNRHFQMQTATLPRRFFAFVIDASIVSIVSYLLAQLNIPFVGLIFAWLYYAGFHSSSKQATIGKQLCKIKVADVNGIPIRFKQASLRFVGRLLSMIPFALGFILILFTEYRQGAHDFLAHTCVYKK